VGLEISDRIHLAYEADGEVAAALVNFGDYIQQETLAIRLEHGGTEAWPHRQTVNVGDQQVVLAFRKVA